MLIPRGFCRILVKGSPHWGRVYYFVTSITTNAVTSIVSYNKKKPLESESLGVLTLVLPRVEESRRYSGSNSDMGIMSAKPAVDQQMDPLLQGAAKGFHPLHKTSSPEY